jgi:hypothetical protein
MAAVEKPQPMDVDPKKIDEKEKVEEKPELVNKRFFLPSHYSIEMKFLIENKGNKLGNVVGCLVLVVGCLLELKFQHPVGNLLGKSLDNQQKN